MNRDDEVTLRKVMSGEWVITKESFMPPVARAPLPVVAPTPPPPVVKQEKETSNSR